MRAKKMQFFLKLFMALLILVLVYMGFYGFFFLFLAIGLVHYWLVRRMPSGKSEGAMGVHHVRSVELRLPYDKAFELCVESLSTIKRCTIRNEERAQGKILARAGINWKTWGDVLSFELRDRGDEGTQIEISSRPAIRVTFVDFGKNLDNVEKISGFLNAHGTSAE